MSGRRWPEGSLQPCGTLAAYRRHQRRGERIDEACRLANRMKFTRNGYPSGRELRAPDYREIRNGLPEFVPYRYRGTGADAYTGEVVTL